MNPDLALYGMLLDASVPQNKNGIFIFISISIIMVSESFMN